MLLLRQAPMNKAIILHLYRLPPLGLLEIAPLCSPPSVFAGHPPVTFTFRRAYTPVVILRSQKRSVQSPELQIQVDGERLGVLGVCVCVSAEELGI